LISQCHTKTILRTNIDRLKKIALSSNITDSNGIPFIHSVDTKLMIWNAIIACRSSRAISVDKVFRVGSIASKYNYHQLWKITIAWLLAV